MPRRTPYWDAREDESRKLQTEESSQKEEVQQLNKKQKQLQADLKKKKKQADALNRQIEKQIAEEIARAEAEAKAARERQPAQNAIAWHVKRRLPQERKSLKQSRRRSRSAKNVSPTPKADMP